MSLFNIFFLLLSSCHHAAVDVIQWRPASLPLNQANTIAIVDFDGLDGGDIAKRLEKHLCETSTIPTIQRERINCYILREALAHSLSTKEASDLGKVLGGNMVLHDRVIENKYTTDYSRIPHKKCNRVTIVHNGPLQSTCT